MWFPYFWCFAQLYSWATFLIVLDQRWKFRIIRASCLGSCTCIPSIRQLRLLGHNLWLSWLCQLVVVCITIQDHQVISNNEFFRLPVGLMLLLMICSLGCICNPLDTYWHKWFYLFCFCWIKFSACWLSQWWFCSFCIKWWWHSSLRIDHVLLYFLDVSLSFRPLHFLYYLKVLP